MQWRITCCTGRKCCFICSTALTIICCHCHCHCHCCHQARRCCCFHCCWVAGTCALQICRSRSAAAQWSCACQGRLGKSAMWCASHSLCWTQHSTAQQNMQQEHDSEQHSSASVPAGTRALAQLLLQSLVTVLVQTHTCRKQHAKPVVRRRKDRLQRCTNLDCANPIMLAGSPAGPAG